MCLDMALYLDVDISVNEIFFPALVKKVKNVWQNSKFTQNAQDKAALKRLDCNKNSFLFVLHGSLLYFFSKCAKNFLNAQKQKILSSYKITK